VTLTYQRLAWELRTKIVFRAFKIGVCCKLAGRSLDTAHHISTGLKVENLARIRFWKLFAKKIKRDCVWLGKVLMYVGSKQAVYCRNHASWVPKLQIDQLTILIYRKFSVASSMSPSADPISYFFPYSECMV
jgi:hypothetical protein